MLLLTGGALMAALWLIFTTVHGPTSFNEDNPFLGGSMFFWGMLLGGIPNLLIAAGLISVAAPLSLATGRMARAGFILLLIGLVVPAVIDLAIRALGAPLLLPLAAAGALLLATGNLSNPRVSRPSRLLVLLIGVLLTTAFAFPLLPMTLTDPLGGFRIYGALAHLGVGIGWALFGLTVLRAPRAGQSSRPDPDRSVTGHGD
ncbi:hypothetical protein GY21_14390 [Cryobacterium roopkundense]|uniref:DUF998 domain-containing protein n=1 Tax=Cryobacterium roopkundense TaxID=1001240 RepID=A0A099J549_9MICO|nr:hypothetical protein GY21_14390 [Cryobacterium roopkundense]